MTFADDVDFQLLRGKHGWSEARLYINGYVHDFHLNHIFNNPIEAICSATVLLAKGVDEVHFSWHDEPGQYDWKLTKIKSKGDLLNVLIYKYTDMMGYYHQQISTNKLLQETNFQVSRDFWITSVSLEIEKISI